MTLPAHRFEERAKKDKQRVWVFDFDETITKAPDRLARIATGLKALGDIVYVLTGNDSPRDVLLKRLADYGFPFDDLVQYEDEGSAGVRRAAYLEELGAWCAFDDRAGRAYVLAKVCPHLFLIAKPSEEEQEGGAGAEQEAKERLRDVKRSAAPAPPNLRDATGAERCGTCRMFDKNGVCWGYGNAVVRPTQVCDSYSPETA